jgi:NADH:ubiquinone oxidoreductase subunit 3 (subunit A)
MRNTLYITVMVLILTWAFLYFALKLGGFVHFLLVVAGMIVLLGYSFRKGWT